MVGWSVRQWVWVGQERRMGGWLGGWVGWVRYLVPRGGVAELWAAVALGWRWSFTVSQPGLGIVTRMGMGGLKGGRRG